MFTITTLPVYSKLAPASVLPDEIKRQLPQDWQLSQHQVDTYCALNERKADVVFNTAMTGDGKSLSNLLSIVCAANYPKVLSAFPTNELIHDQLSQANKTVKLWSPNLLRPVTALDAAALDELQKQNDSTRASAFLNKLSNHDIVLTNPDIFHYVMSGYYIRRKLGDAPDKVFQPMLGQLRQITFDEFHIFQAPQIAAVTNALIFIKEVMADQCPRFLFLSATPNPLMLNYLARANMRVTEVKGQYCHTHTNPDPSQWRLILRPTRISLHTPETGANGAEAWTEANLQSTILPFFLERKPRAKGAIIINSVVVAKRLAETLRKAFQPYGLSVESNTGLDDRDERKKSYDADLLVATSTVDVGVDFKINFLVFESRDAGSFLQRLGRLGRHDGYIRHGQTFPFDDFEAHALLPSWVYEQLTQPIEGNPARLSPDSEIDREFLSKAIGEAFPPVASFENYGRHWGRFQAATIIRSLSNATIRDSYADSKKQLEETYKNTLRVSMAKAIHDMAIMKRDAEPLLDEALSFRGGSLECGLLDVSQPNEEKIRFYDLFRLVSDFYLSELTFTDFKQIALRKGWDEATLDRQRLIGAFRLHGIREKRVEIEINMPKNIQEINDKLDRATVFDEITIIARGADNLNAINRKLRGMALPALISTQAPFDLVRRLRLPQPFPIYKLTGLGGYVLGTIAFGRSALLLDTALRTRKDLHSKISAIYC